MKRSTAVVVSLICWPLVGSAESAYVTDILRLGIHASEDTSDQPFENLVSGTELEILERRPNYARVRTHDGRVGWVKSAFLVPDKPALVRVSEVEATNEELEAALEASEQAQLSAEQEAARLAHEAAMSADSAQAIQETLTRLKDQNEEYAKRLDTYRRSLPVSWVALALVVSLLGGFAAGVWCLDAIIRSRHGGFRIY